MQRYVVRSLDNCCEDRGYLLGFVGLRSSMEACCGEEGLQTALASALE